MSGAVRNWLQSVPIERDGLSWAVSLGVHLTLLVMLAMIWQHLPDRQTAVILSSLDAGEPAADLQEVQYSESTAASEETGSSTLQGTSVALATAPTLADVSRVETGGMEASDVGAADVSRDDRALVGAESQRPTGRHRRRGSRSAGDRRRRRSHHAGDPCFVG